MDKKNETFAVMVVGQQTPSKTYENYNEAEKEAIRLVNQTRKSAFVLKAVSLIELKEIEVTRLDCNDKI
jgi:5-formaminoimidazole-4-carboxamide-1-beta-D-ribofuranosyl 5'-monophosphate synthetase